MRTRRLAFGDGVRDGQTDASATSGDEDKFSRKVDREGHLYVMEFAYTQCIRGEVWQDTMQGRPCQSSLYSSD